MNKVAELASQIREIAYELEVFGVKQADASKEATPSKLYKYEIDGFSFYSPQKSLTGIRLPVGKAQYTKEYFPVSGALAKDVHGED